MFPPTQATLFFFFNDTATTEIFTLSLHDALPISNIQLNAVLALMLSTLLAVAACVVVDLLDDTIADSEQRSEEHTSELQSQSNLVCRLLLEKKKTRL